MTGIWEGAPKPGRTRTTVAMGPLPSATAVLRLWAATASAGAETTRRKTINELISLFKPHDKPHIFSEINLQWHECLFNKSFHQITGIQGFVQRFAGEAEAHPEEPLFVTDKLLFETS